MTLETFCDYLALLLNGFHINTSKGCCFHLAHPFHTSSMSGLSSFKEFLLHTILHLESYFTVLLCIRYHRRFVHPLIHVPVVEDIS